MSATIEDLWPKSIDVRILSPLTILRSQAAFLGKRTGGLLTGQISTDRDADKVSHRFYIVAAAPDRIMVPILEASHSAKEVYPVEVVSRAFEPKPATGPFARLADTAAVLSEFAGERPPNQRTAVTQDAFIALVKQVLNSEVILATINSIIAMSNEEEHVNEPEASARPAGDASDESQPSPEAE